jgi:hypothetical protein
MTQRFLASCFLFLAIAGQSRGYNLENMKWRPGAKVVMQLGLGSAPMPLQDGFGSWNASAADAIAIWNGYVDFISFSSVSKPSVPKASGDGVSSVFFSNTVFGDSFGEGTLAVTVSRLGPEQLYTSEADVVVNTAFRLDSYSGPLQQHSGDIHRIFLHEFGHVLGLDHVTNHPVGKAIMEPIISDLDHLGADDIAGVTYLYGAKITNLPSPVEQVEGYDFSYDPVANNNPTSYSAVGLPPGLTIDPTTGHIAGTVTKEGVYGPVITAHGPVADANGTFQLSVLGLERVRGLLAILRLDTYQIIADPIRPRIYSRGPMGIDMIDTATLEVTRIFTSPQAPNDLSVSADLSKLLFIDPYHPAPQLKKIDLTSFTLLPPIDLPEHSSASSAVFEGLDGRDYVAGGQGILQFDARTGASENLFDSPAMYRRLAISPDHQTLYSTSEGTDGRVSLFDISMATPMLLQQSSISSTNPVTSPDGQYLYYTTLENQESIIQALLPSLTTAHSILEPGYNVQSLALGPQGALYEAHSRFFEYASGAIFVYDTNSFKPTADIELSGLERTKDVNNYVDDQYEPFDVVPDGSGNYLYVTVANYGPGSQSGIWVFSTDLNSFPPFVPPAKNLLNISTRAPVDLGDDAMIGGFIVQGAAPKKLLLRGLGPSLPITGAMANPTLEIYDSTGKQIGNNDDWVSNRLGILGTQLAPTSEREAALTMTLPPGAYTAIVRDKRNQPGQSLVEVYDLDPKDSLLGNISTRGKVGVGDDVMIGGFIIGGAQPTRVLVRALGPSLASQGVKGPLPDPVLELHNGRGTLIATNDDWQSTQQSEIVATGIPPHNPHEASVLATLPPGNYTAIVRGKNNSTGVGLVEVYNLDATK